MKILYQLAKFVLNYHNKKFVDIIVGARPNFIKIYKLIKIFKKKNKNFRLVHTGQHYNLNVRCFFKQLKIKKPDVNLKVKEKHMLIKLENNDEV